MAEKQVAKEKGQGAEGQRVRGSEGSEQLNAFDLQKA